MIVELDNEKTIIERCQIGDIRAYEEIYRHFENAMYSYSLRIIHQHHDAQEAVQLAFIKLYQNIGQFHFRSKFSTYLFKILINVCHDLRKQNQRSLTVPIELHADFLREGQSELKIQLENAIQHLPDRMRECFVLFAVEGFSQDKIAEMLSISTGAVKAHIFKARQRLKPLFRD